MQTVTIQNDTFDVDISGTVHQPRSVSPTVLDDVRVLAGQLFLADRKRPLTEPQRQYWTGVCKINPPNERLRVEGGAQR